MASPWGSTPSLPSMHIYTYSERDCDMKVDSNLATTMEIKRCAADAQVDKITIVRLRFQESIAIRQMTPMKKFGIVSNRSMDAVRVRCSPTISNTGRLSFP